MEEKAVTTPNIKIKPECTTPATPSITQLHAMLPKFSRI